MTFLKKGTALEVLDHYCKLFDVCAIQVRACSCFFVVLDEIHVRSMSWINQCHKN